MGQDEKQELPRYRCHKVVEAFRIGMIGTTPITGEVVTTHLVHEDGKMGAYVSQAYMDKHKPQLGGYYVRYSDGYESWSTAEAFEGGYQLMDGSWNPGEVAFEAYNTSRGGVNHQGNPTPPWAELPGVIRTAWNVAAAAVLSRAHEHLQGGEVPRPGSPG